jgi:hypothetical protein
MTDLHHLISATSSTVLVLQFQIPGGVMKTETAVQTEVTPMASITPTERKPYESPTLEVHGTISVVVGTSLGPL